MQESKELLKTLSFMLSVLLGLAFYRPRHYNIPLRWLISLMVIYIKQ